MPNILLGKTTSKGAEDEDLSIDVLVADFIELVQTIFKDPATAPTFLVITPTSQSANPISTLCSSTVHWPQYGRLSRCTQLSAVIRT